MMGPTVVDENENSNDMESLLSLPKGGADVTWANAENAEVCSCANFAEAAKATLTWQRFIPVLPMCLLLEQQ
jgi:hypothetical protein